MVLQLWGLVRGKLHYRGAELAFGHVVQQDIAVGDLNPRDNSNFLVIRRIGTLHSPSQTPLNPRQTWQTRPTCRVLAPLQRQLQDNH